MQNLLRIAVCGGGTAGHYYPALSVLTSLMRKAECRVMYFTAAGRIDDINAEKDIPGVLKRPLNLRGLCRPIVSIRNLAILRQHFRQTASVRRILEEFQPDLVFSTGGYVSYPVIRASKSLRIPVFIHEQNSLPGLANRRLARSAKIFFLSFEESRDKLSAVGRRAIVTGNPVRVPTRDRDELIRELGFDEKLPFFVVVGGSLGSEVINRLCKGLYERLEQDEGSFQFLHATGDSSFTECLQRFPFVRANDYIKDLHEYIAVAECVIARGGATTIAELMRYKTPGIVIPWPLAADNHQYFNALSLANAGLGCVILENAATEESIYKELVKYSRRTREIPDFGTEPAEVIAEYLLRGV